MANLLFSPSGRIGPGAYLKGAVIIGVISALGWLALYINVMFILLGALLSCLLVIPFIFLSIKRAHDAGKSGWMSLVYLLISIIMMFVINLVMTMIGFLPSAEQQQETTEQLEAVQSGGDPQEVLAVLTDLLGPMILPLALMLFLTPVVTAFLVNLFTKSDNHENQFGPATIGDS